MAQTLYYNCRGCGGTRKGVYAPFVVGDLRAAGDGNGDYKNACSLDCLSKVVDDLMREATLKARAAAHV